MSSLTAAGRAMIPCKVPYEKTEIAFIATSDDKFTGMVVITNFHKVGDQWVPVWVKEINGVRPDLGDKIKLDGFTAEIPIDISWPQQPIQGTAQ